ncbi:MAG: 5-methylcytosine-specific restriction system specificity protein McrC [Methanobrevibacter sp. CfCl-M3]
MDDEMSNEKNKLKIPIQNIYYMLSYAYRHLKIDKDILRDSEEFENVHDLFARVLIEEIKSLVRRGFYREYVVKNQDTSNIKGKINITNTIKRRTMIYKKLNCQYDEFSINVLFNQIIKTTVEELTRFKNLNNGLKKGLKKLKPFFDDVDSIVLNKQIFKYLMWNRNNQHYNLIIDICRLVFIFKLPNDSKPGKIHFKEFIENYKKEMAKLFEKFILNFYKKEFGEFKVHSPEVKWDLDINYPEENGREYLPKMKTDIVLEYGDNQLIIDTKFYKDILSNFHGNSSLNSSNLYQIFSYVNNSNFKKKHDDGKIIGMLLYVAVDEDIDYNYKIGENIFCIKTINLNQNWIGIKERLEEIANIIKE